MSCLDNASSLFPNRASHKPVASSFILRFSFVIGLLAALYGCINPPPPPDEDRSAAVPVPVSEAPERPEVVTDLSKLSAEDTYVLPAPLQLKPAAFAAKEAGESRNDVESHRLAVAAPSLAYHQDAPDIPGANGKSQLLNEKAKKYADFSYVLLNQTLKAVRLAAPEKLEQRRVPDDLKPVVVTAVMDSQGRLHEIIIDQHSGDLAVDHLFIDGCKKGVWSRNPPLGAQDSDGNYRVEVRGQISNLSFDRYGLYSYETQIGIGLL